MDSFLGRRKSEARPHNDNQIVLKHGPVHQWAHRVKSWKKRFLIVDTDQIVLYETAQDLHKDNPAVKLIIADVIGVKVIPADDTTIPSGQTARVFVITTSGRPYYIQAASDSDVEEWVATISLALELSPAAVVGIKQGFVWKKGAQHHNWKRRWFVLTHDSLSYYAKKGNEQPLGVIPLKEVLSVGDAADEMAELTSQRDAFGVATDYRTYVCKCESRTSQDAWIDAVRSAAAIRRILEENQKEKAVGSAGLGVSSSGSGTKEREREKVMSQISSMKRLAQHICTLTALGNRIAVEVLGSNIELRQQIGCVISALGESFSQAAAAFVASLPLTIRVSGEGAHVLRSLRQTRAATDSRASNIIATASVVKEAVAQLLVLVKTAVSDEVNMSVGSGTGIGQLSDSSSNPNISEREREELQSVQSVGSVHSDSELEANTNANALIGSGTGIGTPTSPSPASASASNDNNNETSLSDMSKGQAILRDIVITARQLKANTDAVINSQQLVRGRDEPGRTPQEEIVEVAKEAVSSTTLVANAITGTDAQLVQATKLATGLVQQLIKCAVEVSKNIRNQGLRELIVEAHSSVRDGAIQMVQLARQSTVDQTHHRSAGDGNGLGQASNTLTLAITNLVALAGIAAQHHIAEDQLSSGKKIIHTCMETLRNVIKSGAIDDLDVANKLLEGSEMFVSGIDSLIDTISGTFDGDNLANSISILSQAVSILVSTASSVADGLSDVDLRGHLNRVVTSVKDLSVQLHTVIKDALADSASESSKEKEKEDKDKDKDKALPLASQKASRSCSHILQVASVCKSLSNGYANLVDSAAYVGTKDYRHASEYEASNDVDIWEEESGKCVIYASTEGTNADDDNDTSRPIRAASLNQLVIRLTSAHAVDLKFQKTILTTYRSFTTPYQLFQKLVQRYQVPVNTKISVGDLEQFNKSVRLPIQLRVCNVIAQWIESSYHDFTEELYTKMTMFIEKNVKANHVALATKLAKLLAKKEKERELEEQEKAAKEEEREKREFGGSEGEGEGGGGGGEDVVQSDEKEKDKEKEKEKEDNDGILRSMTMALRPNKPNSKRSISDYAEITSPADVVEKVDEEVIAIQLSLIEWDIYHRIEPVELLRQAWNKEKLRHLAPNVTTMISRFNLLSAWVSSTILWQEKIKQRVKVMSKWVMVAESLRQRNNFNSLLAILSGLNSSGVYRLKFTKDALSKKVAALLRDMEELMNNTGSYKNYRQYLHNVNPPCIPYLGVYFTDLTFIEDGNPDEVDGLINYKKRELVYNVIQEIKQYQQTRYSDIYETSPHLQALLNQMHGADENELYELSLLREPRGASEEDVV